MPKTQPRPDKVEKVAELKAKIESSQAVLLADFRGLTVGDAKEFRTMLAESDTSFAVVKNTLMKRAVDEAGMAELTGFLEGPTGVAFVGGDPVAAAKSIADASKKFPAIVIKGGYMEGKMLSDADAKALAKLESREVMLSKIAGLLKGEMSRAAYMFQALQSQFLSLAEALKAKKSGDEPEAEAEAAPEADAEPEAEAEAEAAPEADAEPEAETEPAPEAEAPAQDDAPTTDTDEAPTEEKE